jgi:hypothetical protein
VVGYLLFTPHLFLLAPLALLLLFSRPVTAREWLWIALAAAGTAKVIVDASGAPLPFRMVTAGSLIATGAFTAFTFALPRATSFVRATLAITIGVLGVVVWSLALGIPVSELDRSIAADLRPLLEQALAGGPADQVKSVLDAIPGVARLFPGWVAVPALGGLLVAWRCYYLIATDPLPPPPGRFRDFRFNDHLVWGAIFTLGFWLLPLGELARRTSGSGLVVWLTLYAARGAAVTGTAVGGWPLPGKVLLIAVSLLVLPVAIGTMTALGLADTWLDFRNRAVPTAGGGNADGSNSS